jgi:hypothetical protein
VTNVQCHRNGAANGDGIGLGAHEFVECCFAGNELDDSLALSPKVAVLFEDEGHELSVFGGGKGLVFRSLRGFAIAGGEALSRRCSTEDRGCGGACDTYV